MPDHQPITFMDTISTENKSYLPIFALILSGVCLILSLVALVKVADVRKEVRSASDGLAKIETLEGQVRSVVSNSEVAARRVLTDFGTSVQRKFDQIDSEMGTLRTTVNRVEIAMKEPTPVATTVAATSGPAPSAGSVSDEGVYTIKAGDTLGRLARAFGVSLDAIESANPGIDPNRLRVGQKIRMPQN